MSRTVGVSAPYRPCPACHRPALVLVDGEVVTPHVIELGWDDGGDPLARFLGRLRRYATPHEAGCPAIRPNHPEGRYIFVPGEAVASSGVGFDGVRLDGPGPAASGEGAALRLRREAQGVVCSGCGAELTPRYADLGICRDCFGTTDDPGTTPDVAPSNGAGGDDRPAPPEGTKEGTK